MTATVKALSTAEILQDIVGRLDPVSLVAATQVSRFWKDQCEPLVWATLSTTDWQLLLEWYYERQRCNADNNNPPTQGEVDNHHKEASTYGNHQSQKPLSLAASHLVRHVQLHSGGYVLDQQEQQLHRPRRRSKEAEVLRIMGSPSLPSACLPSSLSSSPRRQPMTTMNTTTNVTTLSKTMWLTSTNLLALVQSFRHLRSLEIHVVSSSTAGYGMTFSSGKTRPRLIEGLPLALFDNAVLGSLPCLERLDISADQVILNDEESFEGEGAKNTNSSTAARSHCSPKNQFATKAITSKQPLINVERLLLACPRLEMLSLRGPVFSLREEESRGIGSPGISVTLSSHPINRPHDHPRIECNSSPSSTGLVTRFLRSVRLRDIGDVTEADLLRFLTRYGTRIDELDLTGSVCWPWSECFPTTFARACPRLRTLTFNCTNVPFYNSTNLSAHTAHQSPPLHSSSVQQQQQGNSSVQVNRPALMKTALSDDQLADILCALSLSAPLDSSVPTQLHSFTARSCYIGAKALKALEKACSPELRVLDLSMARKIPPDTVGQELHSFLRRNAPALERLDAEGMHIQLLDLVPECDSDDDVDDDDDDDDKENQVIEQGVEHQEKKVEPNKGGSGRRWQWACHQSLESLTIGFSTPVGSDVEPTEEDVADGQTVVFPTVDRQQDAAWRFLASLRRLKHLKIAYSQLNFSLDTLVDEFGRLCKHKDEQILYEPECSFTPPTPPYETKMSSLRGLARLASLTELETLDLETCTLLNSQNQSMELSCRELSWMGQVWPRLRVLRLPERYNRHEKQFQSWFLYGRRLRLAQHHSSSHPQQQRSGQDVDDPVIQILCPLTWSASW